MSRRKPSRIPKKYARRISPDTKRFVKRKMERSKKKKKDQWKRKIRKMHMYWDTMRTSALRWIVVSVVLGSIGVFSFFLFSPVIQVREINVERLSPRLDIEEVI